MFAAALLFSLVSTMSFAQSVWSGNGHSYEAVYAPGLTWAQAQAACEARGGYLATITSSDEDAFVKSLFENNPAFWFVDGFGSGLGPWIGGIQAPNSSEPGEGWGWANGEPMTYTGWFSGEPNNCPCSASNENRIQYFRVNNAPPTGWNDIPNSVGFVRGYIYERSEPECISPPSGLVSWWRGENNANDFTRGNDGTLINGATFAPGKVGQAFSFDGVDDYVRIPASPDFDFSGSFSIGYWFKTASSETQYQMQSYNPATGRGFVVFGTAMFAESYFYAPHPSNWVRTSTSDFNDNQWHYLLIQRDGTTLRYYVDAVLLDVETLAGDITSNADLLIGTSNDFLGFYVGLIDEIELYNRALTASEIQSIYNAGGVGKCTECTPPEVSITGDDPVCPNSTQTYTATTDAANPAFAWSVAGGTINGDNTGSSVSVTAGGVGAMMVSVEVTDGTTNCSNTVTHEVTVEDAEAPVITPATNPIMLWPPNHKYVTINLSQCVAAVSDNCADLTAGNVMISKVTSDEPEDALGGGDGNTENDIVIAGDCQSVQLRSERLGSGNGRVYTIHLSLNDGNGNVGTATRLVTVPKSQNGNPAVDNGIAYEVMSDCNGIGKLSGNTGYTIEHETLPEDFALFQNYPNPFNPTTEISFALPEASDVTLAIYNSSGQLVRLLASGQKAAGRHSLVWDAKDQFGVPVASGVYLYTLKAGNFVAQRKLILMK